jgi:serine/threonine protein phosphatase PrpC
MEENTLRVCSQSDAGIRSGNEDAYSVSRISHPSGMIILLSVADGLGGHPAGEVASQLAVRTLEQIVREQLVLVTVPEPETLKGIMALAFRETNRRVIIAATQEPEWQGMGTTLVAALISDADDCIIGNIGDSRAYRVDRCMERLTRDHSQVQELVDKGILSARNAEHHPLKNIVTRIIGREEDEAEFSSCRLGDARLLLCSDGLLDGISEEEILPVVAGCEFPNVCHTLVERANKRSRDNITVIVAAWPDHRDS